MIKNWLGRGKENIKNRKKIRLGMPQGGESPHACLNGADVETAMEWAPARALWMVGNLLQSPAAEW